MYSFQCFAHIAVVPKSYSSSNSFTIVAVISSCMKIYKDSFNNRIGFTRLLSLKTLSCHPQPRSATQFGLDVAR